MNRSRLSQIFAVALLLIATACGGFSNRGTVENPLIGSTNSNNLSFSKIELTDSSTVLHGVVHSWPGGSIKIATTSGIHVDGVAYPLKSIEGLALDEQVTVPDSGVIHFTMTFPSIPANAKSMDFSENSGDGWNVWDIDLTGEAMHNQNEKYVPSKARKNGDRKLPVPEFAYGDTTVINVHILGYKPEMGDKLTWVANTIHGQIGADTPVTVDQNGNAIVKLSLSSPARFLPIRLDKGVGLSGDVFVAPGENINVYLDSHVTGIWNMNTRDSNTGGLPEDYSPAYSDGLYPMLQRSVYMQLGTGDFADYHWNGDQYTAFLLETYKTLSDSIDSNTSFSEAERRYNKACLTGGLAYATSNAREELARDYYCVNNIPWGSPIPEDSIRMELSPENIKAIAPNIDFSDKYLLLSDKFKSSGNVDIWDKGGVDAGLLKTLATYRRAYAASETGELTPEIKGDLTGPLADEVEANQSAVMARIEALGETLVSATPDVAPDKVFDAIVAPHKGKVVMVDLWNTWCAPCRMAMAETEPEKSGDLSSDDIVWIYIADESSPKVKYLLTINTLKGIHYYLDDAQINALHERFGVRGVPFYILVDRTGKAEARPDLSDHSRYKKAILDALSH